MQNLTSSEMIRDVCGLAVLVGVVAAVNMWSGLLVL